MKISWIFVINVAIISGIWIFLVPLALRAGYAQISIWLAIVISAIIPKVSRIIADFCIKKK